MWIAITPPFKKAFRQYAIFKTIIDYIHETTLRARFLAPMIKIEQVCLSALIANNSVNGIFNKRKLLTLQVSSRFSNNKHTL